MKACLCNRCNQGHAPCPTPNACELPEDDGTLAADFFRCIAIIGALAVLATVLALYFTWAYGSAT